MRVTVLAVGKRCPGWVDQGVQEYAKRLPREWRFDVREITPVRRAAGGSVKNALAKEAARLDAALPQDACVVTLDEAGRRFSTREFARRLGEWRERQSQLVFVIGGADGLDPAFRDRAELDWSLSPLTFPHALVRVLLAEQLYRAWSLLGGHPYHRD